MYSIVIVVSIPCLHQGDRFDKDGGEMDSMDSIPQRRHVWLLETLDISRFTYHYIYAIAYSMAKRNIP